MPCEPALPSQRVPPPKLSLLARQKPSTTRTKPISEALRGVPTERAASGRRLGLRQAPAATPPTCGQITMGRTA